MRMQVTHARELFRAARVARLATADPAGVPHLVPVTFARVTVSDQDWLVFAVDHKPKTTIRLRRLANIEGNPSVCFLVDGYDDDWTRLWWVRADAQARILEGERRDRALAALRDKYEQYRARPPAGTVVGGRVTKWTGWTATDADDRGGGGGVAADRG